MLRRPLTIGVAATAVLAVTVPAYAAWQTNGTGTGTAGARSLPAAGAPTSTGATQESISLSWTAAATPPAGMGNLVERQPAAGGSWTAACTSTHSSPSTATTCTDSSLTAGTDYRYRVLSALGNWRATGAESATLSTQAATATTYSVSLSGTSDWHGGGGSPNWRATVTVTVTDNLGNPLSGYRVNNSWSQGSSGGQTNCTTGSTGTCTIASGNIANASTSTTFAVTGTVRPSGSALTLDPNSATSLVVDRPTS
jgi:hypothetical protein